MIRQKILNFIIIFYLAVCVSLHLDENKSAFKASVFTFIFLLLKPA